MGNKSRTLDSIRAEFDRGQIKLDELETEIADKKISPGRRKTLRKLIRDQQDRVNRLYRLEQDEIANLQDHYDDSDYDKQRNRQMKIEARRTRQRENRKVRNEGKAIRNKALREIVKKADDIKNLNRTDIKQVRSLANQAASDYQAPKIKDLIKNTAQKTSASRSLLSTIAKGAGLFGAGVMVGELVRVHNQIKKNPTERYGSKTLFDILTK